MVFNILLLPFKGTAKEDLKNLMTDLALVDMQADLLPEMSVPPPAHNPRRDQYDANVLLGCTHEASVRAPTLGVTEVDLYVEGLNFVFGLAESPGKAAVISLHRLRSNVDTARLRERAVKEAVHELGHTFGLPHCANPDCVMHFSNSLADTDRKGKVYCAQCRAKLDQ
jgi:archaemetzincin